jgi:hypothetical protein
MQDFKLINFMDEQNENCSSIGEEFQHQQYKYRLPTSATVAGSPNKEEVAPTGKGGMVVPPDFFPVSRMPHSILSEIAYRSRSHENSPKQLPRHERGMMLPVRRTGRQDGCLLESDRK